MLTCFFFVFQMDNLPSEIYWRIGLFISERVRFQTLSSVHTLCNIERKDKVLQELLGHSWIIAQRILLDGTTRLEDGDDRFLFYIPILLEILCFTGKKNRFHEMVTCKRHYINKSKRLITIIGHFRNDTFSFIIDGRLIQQFCFCSY